eukprot:PITA_30445
MSTIIQNEPSSFSNAVKHQVWKDAMTEEYEFIMKNNVWEVVPRPQDKTIVTSKWLYKIKHAADGSTEKLKKALYGLKQAPQAWYERIDSYLMKLGFTRSEADPNLYFTVEDDKPLILVLYVDDLFLTSAYPLFHKCKRELAYEFEMKNQGLEVWQKPREIFLSQGKYVVNILKRFGMMDCKPMTTSRILNFGSYMVVMSDQIWEMPLSFKNSFVLMFLVNLHSNIFFAVSIVSSYSVEPHEIGAKNLLRCLQDTISHGLRYTAENMKLHDYSNAD